MPGKGIDPDTGDDEVIDPVPFPHSQPYYATEANTRL